MKRKRLALFTRRYIFISLLLLAGTAATQEIQGFNYEKMFQTLGEKKEWTATSGPQMLVGRDLLQANPDIAEYMAEYGVEKIYRCRYQIGNDSAAVNLALLKIPNQILAFGLYSVEKSPSLKFMNLGFEAFVTGRRLVCWYGEYLIVSEASDTLDEHIKDAGQIAEELTRLLPKQKRNTPVLDALPEKNRVEHSEKFYVRHWLDQGYFRNIYYADYYTSGGYSRIFVIDNGSTAAADSNFWRYYSFIKDQAHTLDEKLNLATDYFVVDEPLWGKTVLTKKNRIIYGVLDFHEKSWTEDRLAEILNKLKKRKVVKSG